jgi:hypothetical protein
MGITFKAACCAWLVLLENTGSKTTPTAAMLVPKGSILQQRRELTASCVQKATTVLLKGSTLPHVQPYAPTPTTYVALI